MKVAQCAGVRLPLERKDRPPNVGGLCACSYSVSAIIRDASILFDKNVHSRMRINPTCKGLPRSRHADNHNSMKCGKKYSETLANAVSQALHNSVISLSKTYRWEVETYRGNIVFALSRPAQPKQLLQWTLGRTLLGGTCVRNVCRTTDLRLQRQHVNFPALSQKSLLASCLHKIDTTQDQRTPKTQTMQTPNLGCNMNRFL